MFRITEDPSLGSLVQCLAKNYKNDSIVSVDNPLCLCVVQCVYEGRKIKNVIFIKNIKTAIHALNYNFCWILKSDNIQNKGKII